ncbi:uncharacterized protein LOC27207449 [Drosophila simulans]|uniref:uncharacterized protein LOC27207449 n=1 Tax=Drosophila simulans TaxID=7240 RepID=UPI00078AE94D|nr:uncharacterized protein LOC27207449 [Drosophila simulans]KMZ08607.1 uncharacterized protein Dsimw501_GD27600 [Drosophila simulans]
MKISLVVLGLFLAFFFSSQTPTSAFFVPPPPDIFCKYFPNFIFCDKNNNGGSDGSGNSTSPATPGNSTITGTTTEGGLTRSLTPPF